MTKRFRAMFENGVLRPVEPVDLPEHAAFEVEVRSVVERPSDLADLEDVYAVLRRRYDSRGHDVSAHPNEHQP